MDDPIGLAIKLAIFFLLIIELSYFKYASIIFSGMYSAINSLSLVILLAFRMESGIAFN